MRVVSDTSPILNLAVVGQAGLLGELYGTILIPPQVAVELDSVPTKYLRFAGIVGASSLPFLRVEALNVEADSIQNALSHQLDFGEAAALAMSIDPRADLFLTDDFCARRTACARAVPTQGLLGVLLEAKRRGIVLQVRPMLDRMIDEAAFRIGTQLRASFLRAAGEGD